MVREPTDRRAFLAACVSGVAASAGCLRGGGERDTTTVQSIAVAGSPGGEVQVRPPDSVALLDFWATWCAPCKPQMAELRTVRDRFPDLHMLSITNEDDVEAIEQFWRRHDGTWPVAMDPELRTNDRFDVTRIPTLLVLDDSGEATWRHVGLAAADTIVAELDAANG